MDKPHGRTMTKCRILSAFAGAALLAAACQGGHPGAAGADSAASSLPLTPAEVPVDPAAAAACAVGDTLLRKLPRLSQLRPLPTALDSIWPDTARRRACRLAALGHLRHSYAPIDSVLAWLKVRGWSDRTTIGADGPDGTVVGLYQRGVTCLLEGRWDGGDDTDSTYVPSDTIEVHFACIRTIPADTALLAP